MELERYLETKFTKTYEEVLSDLRECQVGRSKWDKQAEIGWRIRNSQLPTSEPLNVLEKSSGVYFKDNWVKKAGKWLVSYLTGSDISADVLSYDGLIAERMELLENEVNFALSLSDLERVAALVINDWFYVGVGVLRTYFNPRKINTFWKTGTPILEHIDARNFWFKSADSYIQDIAISFHAESVDAEDLKAEIAEYSEEDAKKIGSNNRVKDGYFPTIKGQVVVYTAVYKKIIRVKKREFVYESVDYTTGEPKIENWFEFEEEYLSAQEEIKELPDGVYVAPEPIEVELECYFQMMIIPEYSLIKKQPVRIDGKTEWVEWVYTGDKPMYHTIGGIEQDASQYPFGQAYEMKDILDLSVVFMSSLAKQIGNMNKPQPQIFEDAIQNLYEFNNSHWKNDFILKLDPDFFNENRGISPNQAVTYKQTPINDRLFLVMQEYVTNAIKSTSGAVDSARGVQQYSGQSGVLASQLQMASQTYLKEDETKFRRLLDSLMNWLMECIVQNRRHEHYIKGLNEEGDVTQREVNKTLENTLTSDEYYCQANFMPNSESLRQSEKQQVMGLLQAGKFPLKQALEIMDISTINVKQTLEELDKEQGIAQIVELINKHPEIQEQIVQLAQQLESQEQGSMQ